MKRYEGDSEIYIDFLPMLVVWNSIQERLVHRSGGHFINNKKQLHLDGNVIIRPHCDIYSYGYLEIGENTEIGKFSCVASANRVVIGKGVLTGPFIFIADHNHQYENPLIPIYMQGIKVGKNDSVEIGDETWIGAKVAICGNIKIGKHCVIGANSVVTKDIPDYSVAAGIPARVIKKYDFEKKEWVKIYKNEH